MMWLCNGDGFVARDRHGGGSSEGSIPVAQKQGQVVACIIGDRDVSLAVLIQVGNRHGEGACAPGRMGRRSEGSVPVSKQDG